ncbi:MAG TPA: hypothetical protein VEG36_08685 [Burkholderiales bacterium]|nr:hypothetical protein [Burkholderiales bacterium]
MMLAALFLLLTPLCDVVAAPVDSHAAADAAHGHTGEANCCASIDAQAFAVPAIAPLPAVSPNYLLVPSREARVVPPAIATLSRAMVRRDPAPPLPYHARSLRRLD